MSTDLIPPVRLGRLLRQRREELGWSLRELAALHGLDTADLDAMEAGVRLIDEPTMDLVDAVYGIEHGSIVPQRTELVIDIDEGTISAAEHEIGLGPHAVQREQVLTRYLALVYALRGLPLGSPITFRDVDLAVLGQALAGEPDQLGTELHTIVRDVNPDLRDVSRRFRRATVVPLAGLLVGLTAVGGLVLVQRNAGSLTGSTPSPADHVGLSIPVVAAPEDSLPLIADAAAATPAVLGMTDSVEIGDAAVLERPPADQRLDNAEQGIDIASASSSERNDGEPTAG